MAGEIKCVWGIGDFEVSMCVSVYIKMLAKAHALVDYKNASSPSFVEKHCYIQCAG